MKYDIVLGVLITVIVYLLMPDFSVLPSGIEKFMVFFAQCIVSAFVGLLVSAFVYENRKNN